MRVTTKGIFRKICSITLVITLSSSMVFTTNGADIARQSQDVSNVLNDTMKQLAETVTEPTFGTNAGEWTVFSLARGEYFNKDNAYFTEYYNRIVATVNETASSVNKSGALDKNKSTENSRLIVALSAIGKDSTSVGDWDLVEAYSANGINWIKKQGINGTIWSLIALDSGNYTTSDNTIRQQCVDAIISAQHNDGGWSLITNKAQTSNVDITGMTLTALYPYRDQTEVADACDKAIEWLSTVQLSTGGFPYGKSETSESCVWAIVALTTWGINPDTDTRFIKNGKSCIDNLLTYYVESDKMFAHQGTESNPMATDQACYALVAYNRFLSGKTALFDYSDVATKEEPSVSMGNPKAILGTPSKINGAVGTTFNAAISLDQWNNTENFKLIDLVVNVPEGLEVMNVTAGERYNGGAVSYNLESNTGKLRIVYFDANNNNDITVSGNSFPVSIFTITFKVNSANLGDKVSISLGGMSIKRSSNPNEENAMTVVDTTDAISEIEVVKSVSYSAICLYTGDDIDLIPSTQNAVAVSVFGIDNPTNIIYKDATNEYEFKYSAEISEKNSVITYIALVDASINMEEFTKESNFIFAGDKAKEIFFGDTNNDGVINAQDALAAVDTWLRKTEAPNDDKILTLNVNGDGRINTFDALGIVESFVNESEHIIVSKAITVKENN